MSHFTPISALVGGVLVGLAATALFVVNGRIAGVSGIVAGAVRPRDAQGGARWRLLFVAGLIAGGALLRVVLPAAFAGAAQAPLSAVALAGLLVGAGSRWAGGCTSGHGLCGTARLSSRSIAVTALFVAVGMLVVAVVHRGGPS